MPLDALIASDQAILTVRSEPLESNLQGADLNGDSDTNDVAVVSLRNPKTGDTVPIGKVPTGGGPRAVGSATSRVVEVAGAFPTATLEGDLTGFIDTANGDKLGVIRLDDGAPEGFVDLSPASAPRVDPTPEVDGEPIAISNGLVFFREYEQAAAIVSKVDHTDADPDVYANQPIDGYDNYTVTSDISITPDGRYVAYTSTATDIAFSVLNLPSVYVLDRDTDQDGILDEPGATNNIRFLPNFFGTAKNPDISADGRFIVFENHPNPGVPYIARLDRDSDADGIFDEGAATQIIAAGGNGGCYNPSISDDGDRIAFASDATNLGFTDTNGVRDVFVYEISTGQKRWARGQNVPNGASDNPEISGDGLWVAYETNATNHVASGANDTNGTTDVLVFGPRTVGTSVAPVYLSAIADPYTGTNTVGNGRSSRPGLSRDGRFAVFASKSTNLGGGEFLSQSAFLVDRDPDRNGSYGGTATRIRSIPFPNTWDVWPRLSPDGGSVSLSASVDTFGPDPSLVNITYGLVNRATGGFRNGFTTKDDAGFVPEVAPLHAVSEGGRDWAVLENPCTSFFQGCLHRAARRVPRTAQRSRPRRHERRSQRRRRLPRLGAERLRSGDVDADRDRPERRGRGGRWPRRLPALRGGRERRGRNARILPGRVSGNRARGRLRPEWRRRRQGRRRASVPAVAARGREPRHGRAARGSRRRPHRGRGVERRRRTARAGAQPRRRGRVPRSRSRLPRRGERTVAWSSTPASATPAI